MSGISTPVAIIQTLSKDQKLQNLDIEIARYQPNSISPVAGDEQSDINKKLRGKVIQLGDKYNLNELTVVIQAKSNGDSVWQIVGAATTDKSGNFSLDYPYGKYTGAQAIVSLMPDSPVDIEVAQDNGTNETISDDFIFILLQSSEVIEEEEQEHDSDCESPSKIKRLPDQSDLIESDAYAQDIGGTCLNLSTPNRTLREYSYNAVVRTSDPDVANYVLKKTEDKGNVSYQLEGGQSKINREIVDLNNPIRWEDAPDAKSNLSLYQAVTVATGHILHFKSIFKADRYSLGDLVYSLPLAPGQKKQIVVFESSHSLIGAESQSRTQTESLSASLISDRFITDELSGGISESVNGQSSATTSGVSGGLGLGGSIGAISGSLGVSGGYSNSNSSASQNGSRNISQSFDEKLRQQILQNADSYRQLNASVVTTVTEGQEYAVTTETVANHNHCHSLTMMYFEVLRHYAIYQELASVEECVFIPLLLTHFSTENIHKWKDVLAQNLLPIPSNTYLRHFAGVAAGTTLNFSSRRIARHPLLKGFDAIKRIKTDYENVDFPPETDSYADGDINFLSGELRLRVDLPRPKTRYDRIKSLPIVKKTVSRSELDVVGTIKRNAVAFMFGGFVGLGLFGGTSSKEVEEEILAAGQIFDQFMTLDANYETVPPARSIRVVNFQPKAIELPDGIVTTTGEEFFENGINDKKMWETYASVLG